MDIIKREIEREDGGGTRVSRDAESGVNIRFVTHVLEIPLEVPDGQSGSSLSIPQ